MDHWLARAAAMRPDREAVGGLTYAQLLDAGGSAAGALIERGVAPGDRVALALEPGVEFVAALHGCFLAGAVAVPIDLRLSGSERDARTASATFVIEEQLADHAP